MSHIKKIILSLAVLCILALVVSQLFYHRPVRYVVFAGYNADNTIHPYVLTYLKGLNEISDGVVYIADSELNQNEIKKLKGLTIHTVHHRHNEYDWGSYKRGFNWLKENGYLKKADELVFANDSCYAPMDSFKPIFDEMQKRPELDFWGDLQNTTFTTHLQSYFLVFRKPVINSKAFAHFINTVHHHEYPEEYIVNYEIELTPLLETLGYKWDSHQPYAQLGFLDSTDKNSYPLTMISQYHHQFLKRRTFTTNLAIKESITDLLRYIYYHYPKRYHEIVIEIKKDYIPKDLEDK